MKCSTALVGEHIVDNSAKYKQKMAPNTHARSHWSTNSRYGGNMKRNHVRRIGADICTLWRRYSQCCVWSSVCPKDHARFTNLCSILPVVFTPGGEFHWPIELRFKVIIINDLAARRHLNSREFFLVNYWLARSKCY